ncbi:hypothetical protein QM716_10375 [Rhodococcus sp. IEGM 1409]|uniref:hypothetical protein n=1 Tax=Rhodococcus sp. IEGM 1409 TaxID=3047082 RepID=UPI0024B8221D|nr:hypothetical protein [Rhodococcus sp. IEGM 1409]MDI9900260.1 hypothetical protein [Rhodococcus sp. IEGM 1409]
MLIAQAVEWLAAEKRDSENLAMLVDRDDYWLNSEYASWIADPDDKEAQKERERRKREGIKPPPVPVLPPVAKRSAKDMSALAAEFLEKRAVVEPPKPKPSLANLVTQWQIG